MDEILKLRIVEQQVDVFVQQVAEEIIEVLWLIFQEGTRSRTAEKIMDILVSQVQEQIDGVVDGPRRNVSERIGGKMPMARVMKEIVGPIQLVPQEHIAEQTVEIRMPGIREEISEESQLPLLGRMREKVAEQIMVILVPQIVEEMTLIQEQFVFNVIFVH